jgi:hypothetical protein
MRGERLFVMTNLKKSEGLDRIIGFIEPRVACGRREAKAGQASYTAEPAWPASDRKSGQASGRWPGVNTNIRSAAAALGFAHPRWNQIGTSSDYQPRPRQTSVNGGRVVYLAANLSLRADERSVIFAAVGLRTIAMCLCPGRSQDASNTSSPIRHSRVSEWFGWASLSALSR